MPLFPIHCPLMKLRSYTRAFSVKMAKDILPGMIHEQLPPTSQQDPARELETLWKQTSNFGDTWDDAKLREVAHYLLGAKGLRVPSQWEWLIPSSL